MCGVLDVLQCWRADISQGLTSRRGRGADTREQMQERKPAATPQIARMQEEQEKFRTKADAEKRKLLELERQAEELEAKLVQRRKKLGGPNAPRESAAQVRYQILSAR
jgi:predicted  nucleic acid-binding Zn-ribbon protein